MTKIVGWTCDICRRDFREGDIGYSNNLPLEIVIIFSPEANVSSYNFSDVCMNCRTIIDCAVANAIEQARTIEN